jgi:hypothetical protein
MLFVFLIKRLRLPLFKKVIRRDCGQSYTVTCSDLYSARLRIYLCYHCVAMSKKMFQFFIFDLYTNANITKCSSGNLFESRQNFLPCNIIVGKI